MSNNVVIHFPRSRSCIERTVPALQILVVQSIVTSEKSDLVIKPQNAY